MEKHSKIIYQVFNAKGDWLANCLTTQKAQAIVDQIAGAYVVAADPAEFTAGGAQ